MPPKLKRRLKKSSKYQRKNLNNTHCHEYSSTANGHQITEEMLERILFRWYQKYQNKRKHVDSIEEDMEVTVVLSCEDLLAKARSIVDKVDCVDNLKEKLNISWIRRWQKLYGIVKIRDELPSVLSPACDEDNVSIETIREQSETIDLSKPGRISDKELDVPKDFLQTNCEDVLTNEQIYYVYCYTFDLKCLPDANYKICHENDRISVLMAANRSGTHRTRVLVTGKQWRPYCLRHVNMVTQPVIYAGGGDCVVTPELFKWWFYKEFEPVVSMLYSKTILYSDNMEFVNALKNDNARVSVKSIASGCDDSSSFNIVLWEFRTVYTSMILRNYLNFKSIDSNLSDYLQNLTLKDAFLYIHRSWLNVRPETFQRSWMSYQKINNESSNMSSTLYKKRKLIFSSNGTDVDLQGDNNLLLELQWMSHDIGLEVTDDDLMRWVFDESKPSFIKMEENSDDANDQMDKLENIADVIQHIQKVIFWMESEPFDSNLLLCMQDVLAYAKKASKMGLGPGSHPGAAALPFFCHNGEHLTAQPPPAHMGIPPYQLDTKAAGMGEYWRPNAAVNHADWKRIGPALLAASGTTPAAS